MSKKFDWIWDLIVPVLCLLFMASLLFLMNRMLTNEEAACNSAGGTWEHRSPTGGDCLFDLFHAHDPLPAERYNSEGE